MKTIACFGALLAFLVVLSSCSGGNLQERQRMYYLQDNWGRSFVTAKQRQTLNPEAGLAAEPVVGLDGQAANISLDKYRKSFEKEADHKEQLVIQLGD